MKKNMLRKGLMLSITLITVMSLSACSSGNSSNKTEASSEIKESATSKKDTKQDLISELGLEKMEGYDNDIATENTEKLENAGYIIINNNDIFGANQKSAKATLEAMGLKVIASEGEEAKGDDSPGNVYESNYPGQVKISSDYIGAALRVVSEGDQVILTYYK